MSKKVATKREDTSAADPLPEAAPLAQVGEVSKVGNDALLPEPAPTLSAESLVLRYLSRHGWWREVTVSNAGEPARTFQEFTPCACAICMDALGLVGEPSYDA